MIGVVLFSLVSLVYSGQVPTPPSQWPDSFSAHMFTTVTLPNVPKPVLYYSQHLALSASKNYACRWGQQVAGNGDSGGGIDYCDYGLRNHYAVNDTIRAPGCSNSSSVPKLVFRQDFLDKATFIGTDKVNGRSCNHFTGGPIKIGDNQGQMDVWTTNDTQQFPCQISLFLLPNPQWYITWGFLDFNDTIPKGVDGQCSFARLQCDYPDYECRSIRGSDPDKLGMGLYYACDPEVLDCDPVNPGGAHFLPNDLYDHCDWVFNAYFEKYKSVSGFDACNWNGVAELVPPSPSADLGSGYLYHVKQGGGGQPLTNRPEMDILELLSVGVEPSDIICTHSPWDSGQEGAGLLSWAKALVGEVLSTQE